MEREEKLRLFRQLAEDEDITQALADILTGRSGSPLGFLLSRLKERPRAFNTHVLKGLGTYHEPKAIDVKTAELAAVSAATALRCEHCLEAHMARAVAEGATLDEIMDVMLIAGAIADSSTLSVAFRKLRQLEGKQKD